MITSQGAYVNTIKVLKDKTDPIIEKIEQKIKEKIAEGEFDCYYAETVTTEVVKKLRQMGYRVKVVSSEVDDYGNFYPGFLRISWSSPDGQKNLLKRISAKIKSITY